MPSARETFWTHDRYAVVGHSEQSPFPVLTYGGLKDKGKTVYPVDPSARSIEGDPAYPDLASLPGEVDAVVLEVPREQTAAWVERVAEAGIPRVWIHQTRDTPEALELARERGLEVQHGTCAVMYLRGGFPHNLHGWVMRLISKY